MKINDKVEFDPGIGKLVFDFNTFVNEVYSQLMSFSSINQKRIRFKMFNNKIYEGMENNIAFYNGCLLWAYYLKKQNKQKAKEFEGNPYIEQKEDYDFLMQVNFMENYFDSYERDTQYYMGKQVNIPIQWKEILALYKEFLQLNNGFLKMKTTDDLILPDKLQKKLINDDIYKLIQNAIEKSDIKSLLLIKI